MEIRNKQKLVLMYAKLDVEKISSTVCQGIWKEQKRNSDIYQTECRKEYADDYRIIEMAKIKRIEKMKFD